MLPPGWTSERTNEGGKLLAVVKVGPGQALFSFFFFCHIFWHNLRKMPPPPPPGSPPPSKIDGMFSDMIQKAADLGFSDTWETLSEEAVSKIERMCRGVLAAAPDHENAHVFLGLLLLTQRHDVQGARDACLAAFALSQDGRVSLAVLGLRAMVRLAQGDYAGAETDFRTLVAGAAGPEDVKNIVDDAKRVLENLVEAGAPEDAHHLLAKLQDEFPQQSQQSR